MNVVAVVSPVVALAVMTAAVALSVGALINALGDYRALVRVGVNGARRLIARQGIRHQAMRLATIAVLIAAVKWTGEPAESWARELVHGRNAFSLCVALLIAADVLIDHMDLRRLRRKVEHGH